MLRWLAILSLMLFACLAALTVWSCFQPLHIMPYDPYHHVWLPEESFIPNQLAELQEPDGHGYYGSPAWDVGLFPCVLYIRQSQYVPTQIAGANGAWVDTPDYDAYEPYEHRLPLGIHWDRVWHQGCTSVFVAAPVWVPLGALLILPAWQAWRILRRRPAPGLCPKCSYDLRAHMPGQKCPECGTPISGTAVSASSHSPPRL